ncbi:salivary glue protein Sgs-3-like [Haliotis cracherodii]|uniref:salivary glue protein Sgs-3-like n=1 Tax=Haliotis cracherodii TaxID=6455 RepID=UPI0039ED26AB
MDLWDCLLAFLAIFSARFSQATALQSSACYGTANNFLEMNCEVGTVIKVTQVLYGAKLKADNCPVPTVNTNHDPDCCHLTDTTCAFSLPGGVDERTDPYKAVCAGLTSCFMQTQWLDTTGHCSEDYMSHTNFMQLTYICLKGNTSQPNNVAASGKPVTTATTTATTTTATTTTTTTSTTTTPPAKTTRSPSTLKEGGSTVTETPDYELYTGTSPIPEPTTVVKLRSDGTNRPWSGPGSNLSNPGSRSSPYMTSSPSPGKHVEMDVTFTTTAVTVKSSSASTSSFAFTTGMMGGMTAAIVGLMLTIFGFIFYWGRRRRKLSTTKANNSSTVWDFLLAHTVAARTFRRGYDNFSNNRESVSSETDATTGKTTWLPNIRVEPSLDTQSVTSDDNCSIVNINTLGTISSRHDRSEA